MESRIKQNTKKTLDFRLQPLRKCYLSYPSFIFSHGHWLYNEAILSVFPEPPRFAALASKTSQ